MLIHVLGPFQLHQKDASLPPRSRAVLSALAVQPNRAVTTTTLGEWIWGEGEYPVNPEAALHTYISRLRSALHSGAASVSTLPNGYRLEIEEEQIDSCRFERLVADATIDDGTADEALMRSALDLWRGPALQDMPSTEAVQAERSRLAELRLRAIEDYYEGLVRNGKGAQLIGNLRKLTLENPYRERFAYQFMICLAETGRKADALQEYRRVCAHFRNELGVEPGKDLADLHLALLREHSSENGNLTRRILPAQDNGHKPAVRMADDIGDDPIMMLADALGKVEGRAPSITVLAGPPGSGTTTASIKYAWAHRDRYPDGVIFVDLSRGARHEHFAPSPFNGSPAAPCVDGLARRKKLLILDGAHSRRQVLTWLAEASGHVLVTSSRNIHGLPHARMVHIRVPTVRRAARIFGEMLDSLSDLEFEKLEQIADLCDRSMLAMAITAANIENSSYPSVSAAIRALSVPPDRRVVELECGNLSVVKSFERALSGWSITEHLLLRRLASRWPEWISEQELIDISDYADRSALRRLVEANLIMLDIKTGGGPRYRLSALCAGTIEHLGADFTSP